MKFAIGQDSHAFLKEYDSDSPLVIGGVVLPEQYSFSANSDGDVLLHALTNAVSGITCKNILGAPADELCRQGIKDSAEYLKLALRDLGEAGFSVSHVSFSVEAKVPKLAPYIDGIRKNVAALLGISPSCVGLTATTGEGLTAFGRGEGMQVFCCLSVVRRRKGAVRSR